MKTVSKSYDFGFAMIRYCFWHDAALTDRKGVKTTCQNIQISRYATSFFHFSSPIKMTSPIEEPRNLVFPNSRQTSAYCDFRCHGDSSLTVKLCGQIPNNEFIGELAEASSIFGETPLLFSRDSGF